MLVAYARQDDPRVVQRADPAFWHPAYEARLGACQQPLRPLGEFITHLTYGPIITGEKPPQATDGVALVNQGQIAVVGVDLREAVRVPVGCRWDRPSARLQAGDIVFARSGAGSLMRNRLAVFMGEEPAVVGSFVNLIRVQGLDPIYLALFLKSEMGWLQIHRLINGVALPNVSFDEIRGLKVPVVSQEVQAQCRRRYFDEVHPHRFSAPERAVASQRALVGFSEAMFFS